MNSINRVNLIQTLVRQLDKSIKRNPTQARFTKSAHRFTNRLAELDPFAQETPEQALAILVRAILTSQFGETVVNEPAFASVISDVMGSLKLYPNYSSLLQFAQQQCLQAQQQD